MAATYQVLKPTSDLLERFAAYHTQLTETECWPYDGPDNRGYGILIYHGKNIPITKLAWFLLHSEWPQRIYRLSPCKNNMCANPHHMTTTKPLTNPNMARVKASKPTTATQELLTPTFRKVQTCMCLAGTGIAVKQGTSTLASCMACGSNWGVVDEDCDVLCMMCGRVMGSVPHISRYTERVS